MEFVRRVISRNPLEGKLAPILYLAPRQLLEKIIESPEKRLEDWISYIDKEAKELTLIWNNELHSKVWEGFGLEILKLKKSLESKEQPIVWKGPTESFILPYLNKGEIVVNDIVLGIYIRSPFIKFKVIYIL